MLLALGQNMSARFCQKNSEDQMLQKDLVPEENNRHDNQIIITSKIIYVERFDL